MLLLRTPKGYTMVEVLIAIFITAVAITAIFSLQAPAWKTTAKADYLGRAAEIMDRQLENTEAYLVNQCNTTAVAASGIPAIPQVGNSASATYIYASGILVGATGYAPYTITTTIVPQTVSYFLVTVTVTWPPLNPIGITQTIYVARQLYSQYGC